MRQNGNKKYRVWRSLLTQMGMELHLPCVMK